MSVRLRRTRAASSEIVAARKKVRAPQPVKITRVDGTTDVVPARTFPSWSELHPKRTPRKRKQ